VCVRVFLEVFSFQRRKEENKKLLKFRKFKRKLFSSYSSSSSSMLNKNHQQTKIINKN
jgi:hypothetical protein